MNKDDEILSRLALAPFKSLAFLGGGRAQTVAAAYWPQRRPLRADCVHRVRLADGDTLVVVENCAKTWQVGQRIVVMVHGLTGCHESRYMSRIALALIERGFLVMRMNLRGCGPGFGLARQPYHSGRSADSRAVLRWLAEHYPGSLVTQVGFSLGGNLTLKMAGEDGDRPSGCLDSIVAISPPVHLAASAAKITQAGNRLLNSFFVRRLRRHVARLAKHFPESAHPNLPRKMSLVDFDEHFTAPVCGFRNADDYYERSSALPWLAHIRVPGLILCAQDDPVVDTSCFAGLELPPSIELILTERGGHVGFLGHGRWGRCQRWMDEAIVRWIVCHDRRAGTPS